MTFNLSYKVQFKENSKVHELSLNWIGMLNDSFFWESQFYSI